MFTGYSVYAWAEDGPEPKEEYVTRIMNPIEMAEWFSHDEWPMQFLDERWISKEETKFDKQPGFRWTRIAYDSLKNLLIPQACQAAHLKPQRWFYMVG